MANIKISVPKGTKDILPEDSRKWQFIEKKLRTLCDVFNFKELRTPVFEHTELFSRGVGDTSDVVTKEMYTFNDKGGRSITLRPEGTAGIARSFAENSMHSGVLPAKLYYIISCFRYEKPQAGRLREFHQFGVEMMGTPSYKADFEAIMFADRIFKEFNIKNITLNLNNIGCKACRSEYNKKLIAFLEDKKEALCDTCKERMYKNPMRIFDCKSEICKSIIKDAPTVFDCVCDDCKAHFKGLTDSLDAVGIEYKIDKSIVRGLDYYTKTVFEFVSDNIGAQGTVLGGGRYDGLVSEIGGADAPGIGFAMGLERLLLLLESDECFNESYPSPKVFIIPIGEKSERLAAKTLFELREKNINGEADLNGRSVKAQMKYADKLKAKYTLVFGDDEIENDSFRLKNMETGEAIERNYSETMKFLTEEGE